MSRLAPYRPSPKRPWNYAAAAHLLRRAGFAPSAHEVRAALADGPTATVDRLVNTSHDAKRYNELDALGRGLAVRNDIDRLRAWWMLRMRHTQRPLRARMSLLWHDHFATSNAKVRDAGLMLQQLRTFERHALGHFEDLLLAVSRDPAMIVWLDGDLNVKGRPNENYARELFELFGLGVGNYTENDIREAARAFTGWHQRKGRFRFVARAHDTETKTVFGKTGAMDGGDVVGMTVAHPACSRFIALKLLREFLCPEPPSELIEALAAHLRDTQFDLAAALKTLLGSEAMFEPRWYRARIKSPVELVIGLARSLEARISGGHLASVAAQMGQRLFEPPSVKGWDGHQTWINSTSMLVRLHTTTTLARVESEGVFFDLQTLRKRYDLDDRKTTIEFLEHLTLDGRVPSGLRDRLVRIEGKENELVRHVLSLLLTSPEYQLG